MVWSIGDLTDLNRALLYIRGVLIVQASVLQVSRPPATAGEGKVD